MKPYYAVIDLGVAHMPPMEFCVGGIEPDSLALWHGDASTMFHNYEEARRAIRKTQWYAKRYRLDWGGYRIVRAEVAFQVGKKKARGKGAPNAH